MDRPRRRLKLGDRSDELAVEILEQDSLVIFSLAIGKFDGKRFIRADHTHEAGWAA